MPDRYSEKSDAMRGDIMQIVLSAAKDKLFRYDLKTETLTLISPIPNADSGTSYSIEIIKDFDSNNPFIDDRDWNNVRRIISFAKTTPTTNEVEFRAKSFIDFKKGSWYRATLTGICDNKEGIIGFMGKIVCIDQEIQLLKNVKKCAESDKLTGLFGYERFCEKISSRIDKGEITEGHLIYVRLANLKDIACSIGFDFTDAIIRRFGSTIKRRFSGSYMIGRCKEDFYLFCPETNDISVCDSACRALFRSAKTLVTDNPDLGLQVRIGRSYFPDDADNTRLLIVKAEHDSEKSEYRIDPENHMITDSLSDQSPYFAYAPTLHTDEPVPLSDKLLAFCDSLFYNFKTFDETQKAYADIAPYLGISMVIFAHDESSAGPEQFLYKSNDNERGSVLYRNIHHMTISHSQYCYRVFRFADAPSLSPYQADLIMSLVRITHTYINRFESMETAKFAQTHDMFFGCLNSLGFDRKLTKLRNKGIDFSDYAVLFMNVKEYKNINSKVGFANGNSVIAAIVDYFKRNLDKDEVFARVGGDNFTVLLKKDELASKLDELNRITCEISCNDINYIFNVSFRIGVYCIEPMVKEIVEIRENASLAYSFTRQPGSGDIVYYTPEKRSHFDNRKYFLKALDPALKNGEFHVYFQPKVDLESYKIVGAEALSRWHHNGTVIQPTAFIPIFVENNLVFRIDFYVFETVCRTISEWISRGITPVTVSVNFEKSSLETPDFANRIFNIAKKYNTPVEYLEIEFTETSCMENEAKFNDILADLKSCGFRASLDDFGKGYSSINMLKLMNFDTLKLDKCFLSEESVLDERSKIILRSIINMAHTLNIEVISEGVETLEQINSLKLLNCKTAQGYYFDEPLPADGFLKKLCGGKYDTKQ